MIWEVVSNILTVLMLIGLLIIVYAYTIEPHFVDIQIFKLKHGQKTQASLRLIQISDIHLGYHVSLHALEQLVQKVNTLKPDLLVITGDLLDYGERYKWGSEAAHILSRLDAAYGKYAIYGNHEYMGNGVALFNKICEIADCKLLKNEVTPILHPSLKVALAGSDCAIYGRRQPEFCEGLAGDAFNILLLHQADASFQYLDYPIHLTLSGHTHGGQIAFPIIGAPILPEMGKKFVKGWYDLDNPCKGHLYVNRGFGMTMLPFRLMSRPEISVFDIEA